MKNQSRNGPSKVQDRGDLWRDVAMGGPRVAKNAVLALVRGGNDHDRAILSAGAMLELARRGDNSSIAKIVRERTEAKSAAAAQITSKPAKGGKPC